MPATSMQEALISILDSIKSGNFLSAKELDALLRSFNERDHDASRRISKRRLLSFYMDHKRRDSGFYKSLSMTEEQHGALVSLLRAKPRRTASGVATVSVLTMPWPCKGDCIYCPNDVMMPKSYMRDEPACQRALRCHFDPYLQVALRLMVLEDMGHSIDKVELIVLGGTFSDYPSSYREWFTKEMFRALNEARGPRALESIESRRGAYGILAQTDGAAFDGKMFDLEQVGDFRNDHEKERFAIDVAQNEIDNGNLSYNEAIAPIYSKGLWKTVNRLISNSTESIEELHAQNEVAASRNVGLVFETRPECINEDHLKDLRRLGATKIQMGIQSLDDGVLDMCERPSNVDSVVSAMSALRKMGFKSHVHFMANLPGSYPDRDISIWDALTTDCRYLPDEVKVYPCALVKSAKMMEMYENGSWLPYSDDDLMSVLIHCLETAPEYMRISRMIRDICSQDIVAGNKHTNLRQMVEEKAVSLDADIVEMRFREIGTDAMDDDASLMSDFTYETTDTFEHFLQWTNSENKLLAFCRLSIPKDADDAMIRELHVYGKATDLGRDGEGAQHKGLGRKLVWKAKELALDASKMRLKVISAIGTRDYYRSLGFEDDGLYQAMGLR